MHQRTLDTSPTGPAGNPDDETAPPACAGCRRPLGGTDQSRYACWPCADRTDRLLGGIPDLFGRLNTTAALTPAGRPARNGNPTSSLTHAPLPLRLEIINLAAAGGIPTRLQAIEDSWRVARGWTIPPYPARAVAAHVKFLRMNLLWACDGYDAIGQDLDEVRHIHTEATAALSPDPRPGRVGIGNCPITLTDRTVCGTPLTASTADQRVTCRTCGTRWAGLTAWRELRRAQQSAFPTAAVADTAAQHAGAAA